MKIILNVSISSQNSRVEYVLDTICEWYGWLWRYNDTKASPNELSLTYGTTSDSVRPSVEILDTFGIDEIGEPQSNPIWDEFLGVPNPCKKDPIAGIFYLLTCAEEYTVNEKDEHNRVRANDLSIVQQGYASIPLADRLVQVLAKAVWQAAGFQGEPEMKRDLGYSSLDIDQVYAVKHKAVHKQLGNLVRETFARGWSAGKTFASAMRGSQDPFDQFDWIKAQHEERGLTPFLFMLMGYENRLDPAWKPEHKAWPSFVDGLKEWGNIGIHPSYYSSTNSELLANEKRRLEKLLDKPVTCSRQHYLKISWPQTFESLLKAGITDDFSVAWPDCLGFRMGTARSCYWYNLAKNEKTSLRLHPPTVMEVTGRFYLKLSPKQFLEKTKTLSKEAALSNSGLRVIWHNSNLSPVGGWAEWKEIYSEVLDLIEP